MRGRFRKQGRNTGNAETQFAQLFDEHSHEVLAYALRRLGNADDAADVVSETFLVAWRHCDGIPEGAEVRFWLFGVARRVLANQQRGERRASSLARRLRSELATTPSPERIGKQPSRVMRALACLSEDDRELLLLVGWEELKPGQVAQVLGISSLAARSRLHRARRRLKEQLKEVGDAADDRRPELETGDA